MAERFGLYPAHIRAAIRNYLPDAAGGAAPVEHGGYAAMQIPVFGFAFEPAPMPMAIGAVGALGAAQLAAAGVPAAAAAAPIAPPPPPPAALGQPLQPGALAGALLNGAAPAPAGAGAVGVIAANGNFGNAPYPPPPAPLNDPLANEPLLFRIRNPLFAAAGHADIPAGVGNEIHRAVGAMVRDVGLFGEDDLFGDGLGRGNLGFRERLIDDGDRTPDAVEAPTLAGGPALAPPREEPPRIEAHSLQESNATCPICSQTYRNSSDGQRVARVLSCGHLVCTGCAAEFRRQQRANGDNILSSTDVMYDRAPCIVCRRKVRWRNLPECKAVGYLYSQLELTNAEQQPLTEVPKIRADTRKRAYRNLDSVNSATLEIASKMRKMTRKADTVYDGSLEESNCVTDRDTMARVDSKEQGDWLVKRTEDELTRVRALEEEFNVHYRRMGEILDQIATKSLTMPLVIPKLPTMNYS